MKLYIELSRELSPEDLGTKSTRRSVKHTNRSIYFAGILDEILFDFKGVWSFLIRSYPELTPYTM